MKSKILPLIIVGIQNIAAIAQVPSWQWALSAAGDSVDWAYQSVVYTGGYVYLAGDFRSPQLTFGSHSIVNNGEEDIYIVKLSTDGSVIWARGAGGKLLDWCFGLAADGESNLYITGFFNSDTIRFGTLTAIRNSQGDMYIAKLTSAGDFQWVRNSSGDGLALGFQTCTDGVGNVVSTGMFIESSLTFGATTLTNQGSWDLFLVKYSPNGDPLWARGGGGAGNDYGNDLTSDGSGNLYLTGQFGSPYMMLGGDTVMSAGGIDGFLAKFDSLGDMQWVRTAGGPEDDFGRAVAAGPQGNVVIAGYYRSSSFTIGSNVLNNLGETDAYVAKFAANGDFLWSLGFGGMQTDIGMALALNEDRTIYMTGYYWSPSLTLGSTTLNNAGASDIFLTKLTPDGGIEWALSVGSDEDDLGEGVIMGTGGNVYLTGRFNSNSISFGPTTLTNTGDYDIFLAKLDDNASGTAPLAVEAAKVRLHPNPFSEFLIAQLPPDLSKAELRIYDIASDLVCQTEITHFKSEISLDLPVGTYFYVVVSDDSELNAGKLICIR